MNGGAGIDTLSYTGSLGAVNVSLSTNSAVNVVPGTGDADGDTIAGFENLIGSDHDDTIRGSSADNHLVGGDGNDTISTVGGTNTVDAGAGSDTIFAGGLRNTIDAGSGDDRVIGSDGVDTIDLGLGDMSIEAIGRIQYAFKVDTGLLKNQDGMRFFIGERRFNMNPIW